MHHRTSLAICPALWRSIPCQRSELRLDFALLGGQSFRWKEWSPGYWTGVLHGRVWTLTQTDEHIWYTVYDHENSSMGDVTKKAKRDSKSRGKRKEPYRPPKTIKPEHIKQEDGPAEAFQTSIHDRDCKKDEEVLRDYFQLGVSLKDLYQRWGKSDPNFQKVAQNFPGIRILRQNPTECLFSFICTSNNHISRITGMIDRVCGSLGRHLCRLDSVAYCDFPTLQALAADDTEAKLRELGFGYRAKFVSESARTILYKHGPDWLESLRPAPYEEAKSALCALPGVGAKVADCVCLMALDKAEAVPVDTHVWQIAKRDYLPQLGQGNKTLTDRVYKEIGGYFRNLWGPYAGWAQSVLFCSDLKKFHASGDSNSKTQQRTKNKKTAS
ncbi:N-glycosylase/DNA lyase [Spea bombifrons]|uniref:N-glycosylase/DNA lyase n=1 Tax=Spea bombifrons TaxID=233779 RepID=UPI002348F213|nr:N-glycosylase/DNA lyase [Spea bombifrons]